MATDALVLMHQAISIQCRLKMHCIEPVPYKTIAFIETEMRNWNKNKIVDHSDVVGASTTSSFSI